MSTLSATYQKDKARAERVIWSNIEKLSNTDQQPKINRPSAEEKWTKLRELFVTQDQSGRKVAGRSLRDQYWREGYNKGEYEKVDDEWHNIWLQSKTDLSFVPWCKAIGLDASQSTAYYNDVERESLRVNMRGGKLYDNNRKPIDTTHAHGHQEQGVADLVMAMDGSFYCYGVSTSIHKQGMQHHSGILSGQPVLFAGEIGVQNGEIVKITTRSGHYKPEEKQLITFLDVLKDNGVNLKGVIVKDDYCNVSSY